jgi:hypothetical protein
MMGGKQVNSRAYLSVLTLVEENKQKKVSGQAVNVTVCT